MTSANGDAQTSDIDVVCQSSTYFNKDDPLDHLPNEILWMILSLLSVEDLCHLAECNKAWRNVTNTNSLWLRLCRLRGWERFGTEVDLCAEETIQAAETSTSGSDPTFPIDSVITDNCYLNDLTPTCEWKEVYMRAWHLNRNWSEGRYRERRFMWSGFGDRPYHATDGRRLAERDCKGTVRLWDMSARRLLLNFQWPKSKCPGLLAIKHNIGVASFKGGFLVFEASTGKVLKRIQNTVPYFDQRKPDKLYLEEDKVIAFYEHPRSRDAKAAPGLIWDITGLVKGGDINVQCTETKLSVLNVPSRNIRCLACQGHFLLSTCDDDTAFSLWDTSKSEHVRIYKGHSGEVCCGHLHENTIMTGDNINEIKVWSVDLGVCLKTLSALRPGRRLRSSGVRQILFNAYGIVAIVNMANGRGKALYLWSRDGSPLLGEYKETVKLCHNCKMHGNKLIVVHKSIVSDQFSVLEVSTGKWLVNRKLTTSFDILHMDDTKIVIRFWKRSNVLILQYW